MMVLSRDVGVGVVVVAAVEGCGGEVEEGREQKRRRYSSEAIRKEVVERIQIQMPRKSRLKPKEKGEHLLRSRK